MAIPGRSLASALMFVGMGPDGTALGYPVKQWVVDDGRHRSLSAKNAPEWELEGAPGVFAIGY
ncbi:MAG: hypothetical protein O7B26_01005 [Planctomycetota bacterium]|nr:hypothetical protein [Planctomycetota bacterium]